MPRLWYPERFHVEYIAHRLAANLFPGYEGLPDASYLHAAIHDEALLESALAAPRQPYYRNRIHKAGALLRSMVKDHPFVDGNKRLGMATTFLFLWFNGCLFAPTNEEMVRFALDLARSSPTMPWQQVAMWIEENTVQLVPEKRMVESVVRNPGRVRVLLDRAKSWQIGIHGAFDDFESSLTQHLRRQ